MSDFTSPPDDAPRDDIASPGRQGSLGASATLPAGSRRAERAAHRESDTTTRGRGLDSPPRTRLLKRPVVLLVLALVLVTVVYPIVRSSLGKTPRNMYGISYGGGPIEGTHFQRIV